jgi:MFS family permease
MTSARAARAAARAASPAVGPAAAEGPVTTAAPTAGAETPARRGSPMNRWRRAGVWHNPDFRLLWGGQTISQLGSQVTVVVLPLLAVVSLHASIAEMGVLGTVARLPFLLYLVAGVWVDQTRKRPVLIGTDLGRGILLLAIPVAAMLHVLTIAFLIAVLFLVMLISVWFDIAYLSYVPALVERQELTTANTIMETSNSTAQVAGNSIGGFLVELLTAPVAIVVDSVSYFISGAAVWRIRRPEPPPPARASYGVRDVASSVATGLRFIRRHPVLGPLALAIGVDNVFWSAELALYVFYLARDLHLGAGVIGLTLAAAGPGAVAGAAFAGRAQRLVGVAGAVISGLTLFAVSALLIPLAPDDRAVAVPMLAVAGFLMSAGGQLCSINVITTRQTIAPPELLGRINASFRFMALGTSPFGSVLGGVLGTTLGARDGLFAAVAGMFLAPLIVALSPARRLRHLPGPGDEQTGGLA